MKLSIKFRKDFSKKSNIVEIHTDCVIKSLSPESCIFEAWKTQKGKEIGEQSGTFYTPSIIVKHEQSIVFEKMTSLTSMRFMLSDPKNIYLAKNIGEALACIHRHTYNLDTRPINLPSHITDSLLNNTFFHGDFNTYNLLYDNDKNRLCIIDWAPPSWALNYSFSKSHYFDISIFIISVFSRRLFEPKTIPNPNKVIDDFLISYQNSTTNNINQQSLHNNLDEVLQVFSSSSSTFIGKLAKLTRKTSFRKALKYSDDLTKRGILTT